MKKVVLTLLAVIVVLGLFAAAGYAGYRFGYAQGAQVAASSNPARPQLRPFDDFGQRGIPGRNFGFGFERGMRRGFGMFPMMGFGFFSPFMFLGRLAVLALVIWFIYWLFIRSGWRLTRAPQTITTQNTTTQTSTNPPASTESGNQDEAANQ
ncbi:MAG TPA: hypothetical protein VK249_10615 [Anaerolineales bacterium]|nr:hypothetical protein [Anaerolineales bacterium]